MTKALKILGVGWKTLVWVCKAILVIILICFFLAGVAIKISNCFNEQLRRCGL